MSVTKRKYKQNRDYNYNRAPKLTSEGEKFKKEFTMGKAIMPHELVMACSICLNERDFAAYKLMMFLCSNADGFGLATETICNRCGFAKSTYLDARKKLIEKGWISLIPRTAIIIHYDKIYSDYEAKLEEIALAKMADDSNKNQKVIEEQEDKLLILNDESEHECIKPKKENGYIDDSAFSAVFSSIPDNDFYMNVGKRKEETKEETFDEDELPF